MIAIGLLTATVSCSASACWLSHMKQQTIIWYVNYYSVHAHMA